MAKLTPIDTKARSKRRKKLKTFEVHSPARSRDAGAKAIELIGKHDLEMARKVAWERMHDHEEGTDSRVFWSRVVKALNAAAKGRRIITDAEFAKLKPLVMSGGRKHPGRK